MCNDSPPLTPQHVPTAITAHTVVRARRWLWRVRRTHAGFGCAALDLSPLAQGAPALTTLLVPFDAIAPVLGRRWRRGSRHRLDHLLSSLSGVWTAQDLAAVASLRTQPWPHQLAPALALVHGRGTRLLIADAVGLGKTLTAAVVLAELVARGLAARVVIVVPAGLRDQWRTELAERTAIAADIVDAAALAIRSSDALTRPGPWAGPGISIVSVDFAKQPAVFAGLLTSPWDLLIVDEAHLSAGESARAAAVSRIAAISRVVLLLTATPHSGDRRAFQWLLALGGTSEPMLWFRRERSDVGFTLARRTRWWHIHPSSAEARMLEALRAYARRVDRQGDATARLAMIVLRKRALSSAFALGRSLIKRRRLLSAEPDDQMLLPFGSDPGEVDNGDGDEADLLGAPGLPDRSSELAALDRLVDLAREAEAAWAKWKTMARLVRRTTEPILVFTEYRDTLEAIARKLEGHASLVVLHGGLPREARAEAIGRFTSGQVRVLVATDVAAEGLNLQARCRLVVNVELPWTPTRLEQRAGRVDRLGQFRPVRVWTLAGASGHEAMVVAALARRAEAIRSDLGQGEPVAEAPPPSPCELDAEARRAWQTATDFRRTWNVRSFRTDPVARETRREGPIWIRPRRRRAHDKPAIIIVFSRQPTRLGDPLAHVAVRVELTERLPGTPRAWLPLVTAIALPCAQHAFAASSALINCLVNRERSLQGDAAHRVGIRPWQPSFFDRRADRVVHAVHDEIVRLTELHDARLRELTTNRHDDAPPDPVFALVLD